LFGIVARCARAFNRARRSEVRFGQMLDRHLACRVLAGVLLAAIPGGAFAQSAEYPDVHAPARQVAGGGELAAIAGRRDNTAFFNYTDYERNALRIARLRLFGEWRPSDRLSVIGELRTENADDLTAPGLYVRWRPIVTQELFIQAGRIPPVVGGFGRHAYGRDNIVIGQPLAYQYLTSVRPDALPATVDDLVRMRGRGWQTSFPLGSSTLTTGVPLISISKWDTGVSGLWRYQWIDIGMAVTRGSPAVPIVRETNSSLMWSGRIAAHVRGGTTVGLSAARGQWLTDDALIAATGDRDRPAAQSILGGDLETGIGKWLIRAEWLRSTFELPIAQAADPDGRLQAWSHFVEARYRIHPRFQLGLRVDRITFSRIKGELLGAATWDADVDRIEGVLGFRATRHIELRGGWQHNWRDGGRVRERGLPALALLYWF
jgi:hypothetical protein